ncbi:uncharacterized protein VTP21DRAFT_6380 [Calcarisporiella thermophila]|uniref:uncharacterized protein n=1 Tax=Calcarisporiella thermophila TaxID=911321 RepID=UPI003743C5FD
MFYITLVISIWTCIIFASQTLASVDLTNTAFLFCDLENDVLAAVPNDAFGHQFFSSLQQLWNVAHGGSNKNVLSISTAVRFRKGYPDISSNNKALAGLKASGGNVLVEGTHGADFNSSFTPTKKDIVIVKRRADATYNTDLLTILDANNINHIILAGFSTSGVILSTTRSASDRDYKITIVRDACADANQTTHNFLMNEIFPQQANVVYVKDIAATLKKHR